MRLYVLVFAAALLSVAVLPVRAADGGIPPRAAVGLTALRTPAPWRGPVVRPPGPGTGVGPVPPGWLAAEGIDSVQAQPSFNATRYYGGLGVIVAADALVMAGLARLWYTGDTVAWHWYSEAKGAEGDGWLDDWHTYVQQDKLGHFFVAWQLARVFGAYGRWAGLPPRKAGLFGAVLSAAFQTQIEFFDGFDPAYGASRTDIAANILGGAIGGLKVAYPETLAWFDAKYSYHPSPYYDPGISPIAPLRLAGNSIKDYDGISYWLAFYPSRGLSWAEQRGWPDWLGISIGYSGTGLAHPESGHVEPRFEGMNLPNIHHRQVFLGPDFDVLRRLPVPKWLVPVRTFFSYLRVPAPALELGGRGTRWHWLYY